jgi:hypothetical protein
MTIFYLVWLSTYYCNRPSYFINDDIHYLINHCILRHTSSTVYYPQGNGQVESINKVFGTLLTKLVNENLNDWDEHLSIVLLFDMIVFKVGTGHIPFQLVYGLYCRAPKFLVDPFGGPSMAMRKELELGARSRLLALEGG